MQYLIVIFTLIGLAYANHPDFKPYNESSAILFHGSDIDGDGIFSRQELEQVFVKYDADGDGRVSRHEYTTYLMQSAPTLELFAHALYDNYNVTGDHHLDHQDFDLYYAKLDADGDGNVTYDEFVPYWTDVSDGVLLAPILEQFAYALYDDYDVTKDHRLHHQDFDLYYAKLDADGDGNVTYDEFVPYLTDLS